MDAINRLVIDLVTDMQMEEADMHRHFLTGDMPAHMRAGRMFHTIADTLLCLTGIEFRPEQ